MKILRPQAVTDSVLDSSNVAETVAAYNAGTTYATGNEVQIDHRVYESLIDSNTGNSPPDNPDKWLDIGPTNRWAMFDSYNNTATTNADSIDVVMTPDQRVDAIAFLTVDAAEVYIKVTDPIAWTPRDLFESSEKGSFIDASSLTEQVQPVYYDQTHSLTDNRNVGDWYSYFFEPIIRKSSVMIDDLPLLGQAQIEVSLNATGTVSCGNMIIGQQKFFGLTLHGMETGILDYSRKSVDDFGNTTVTERAFAKRGSFRIAVDNNMVDEVQRQLTRYRATPIVYNFNNPGSNFDTALIFGFYREFRQSVDFPLNSYVTIEVEGLI